MKEELKNPDRFLRFFFAYLASELNKAGISLNKLLSDLNNNFHIDRFITHSDLMSNFFVFLVKASVGRPTLLSKSSEFADLDHVERVSHVESRERMKNRGRAIDDHGNQLDYKMPKDYVEVAHVIPHSLLAYPDGASELMFSPVASIGLEGVSIDTPKNALTLACGVHRYFDDFEIVFEHVQNTECTYNVDHINPLNWPGVLFQLPVTVTFDHAPSRDVELLSRQLLGIHRAITRIRHLSAAGTSIAIFAI
ncbi:hypothetical protein V1514DRAFT_321125 [Lipomyces japonicus]|uniref:uncharacterized protein n=1 Tax=Lipomyces japonicus TaxID=56871 RepID=UPI0034CFD8C4